MASPGSRLWDGTGTSLVNLTEEQNKLKKPLSDAPIQILPVILLIPLLLPLRLLGTDYLLLRLVVLVVREWLSTVLDTPLGARPCHAALPYPQRGVAMVA